MIDYDHFCRTKRFREQGLKAGQIAVELGLDSRTVGKWMDQERFQHRLPGLRASKLDPYKNDIVRMLERHPCSAQQIFQQITGQGYIGGYTNRQGLCPQGQATTPESLPEAGLCSG